MTLDEFKEKYLGQPVNFDGAYPEQCVDLVQMYNKEVIGAPAWNGDAHTYARNPEPSHYEYHKNTPLYIPPKGAIAVWNSKVGYGHGHTAIVLSAGLMSFTSIDQNWVDVKRCTIVTHTYTNVDCFLVPRGESIDKVYNQLVGDLQTLAQKYHKV